MEILLELGARCVRIKGDSELVLKQLTKEYKCAKQNLIMYYAAANALLKRFTHVEVQHIPRTENQEATDLGQMASGYKVLKEQIQEVIEIRNKRSSREAPSKKLLIPKFGGVEASDGHTLLVEIFVINNFTDNDWRKPIVNYLENPDGITCRKI